MGNMSFYEYSLEKTAEDDAWLSPEAKMALGLSLLGASAGGGIAYPGIVSEVMADDMAKGLYREGSNGGASPEYLKDAVKKSWKRALPFMAAGGVAGGAVGGLGALALGKMLGSGSGEG